ncbi:Glucose-repressible alcohol dehydrogenase transcriptional effector, partial [Nowakowskiella sp. JEL0078]
MESRFQLLAVQAFAYHDQVQGSDFTADLKDRLNPFSNIALVCVLQNRQSSKSLRVRVVNTHFHWDPNFGDTKLLQAAILMEWLEKSHKDVPTVIAADLNSRVGDPVLDYLVRGRVAPGYLFSGKDFGRFSGGPWPVLPPPPTISATTSVVIGGLSLSAAPSVSVITPDGSIQAPTVPRPNSIGSPSYSSVTVGSYPRKGVPIHPSSITQNSTNLDFSPRSFPDGTSPSPLPVFQPVSTQMQQPPFLLRHGTKLASAYDRRDLPFTNKTPEFCGSIDHILYTSGTLSIRDVLADLTLTPFDKPLETEITGVASQASTPSVEKNEFLDTSLVAEDTKFGQNQAPSPATTEDQIYRPVFRNQTPEYSPIEISKTINSTLIPIPSQDNAEKIGSENPPISGSPVPGPPTTSANPMPYVNPNPTFLSKIQALPSKQFPSDHIPLIAVLKWKTVPILSPSSGGGRHSHGGSGSWKRGGGLSGHGSYIEENQMGSSPASYQNTYSVGGAPQNFQRVSAPLTNIHSALTN